VRVISLSSEVCTTKIVDHLELLALIGHVQEAYQYTEVRVAREQDMAANQNYRTEASVSVGIACVIA
jgi:hypothetical protein